MSLMDWETREPRFCRTCGRKLVSYYYYMGHCAKHFKPADHKLVEDAKAAKEHGLSYGKYIALRKEGLI